MTHRMPIAGDFRPVGGEVGGSGHHRAFGADMGLQRAEIRRAK